MTLQQLATETDRTIAFKDPIKEMDGNQYMRDAKGSLVPLELVKPAKKLEDDTVRRMIGFATDLNEQMRRFFVHCFDDIAAFEALLADQYDAKVGGKKGNMSLMSFDGCMKVQVQVADLIDFGPELHVAKSLVDECLNEWASDARPEIRAAITSAFNTDKAGQINRTAIFILLRLDIDDPRWLKAMDAIRDAIRVIGSKAYIRFYQRQSCDGKWQPISIDLAKV